MQWIEDCKCFRLGLVSVFGFTGGLLARRAAAAVDWFRRLLAGIGAGLAAAFGFMPTEECCFVGPAKDREDAATDEMLNAQNGLEFLQACYNSYRDDAAKKLYMRAGVWPCEFHFVHLSLGPETIMKSSIQEDMPVIIPHELKSPPPTVSQKKIYMDAAADYAATHYAKFPAIWKECGPRIGMFHAAMAAEGLTLDQRLILQRRLMHYRTANRMAAAARQQRA